MNPGEMLGCCNTSYCNNHQKPSTTAGPPEQGETTTTIAAAEVVSTGREAVESTSGE